MGFLVILFMANSCGPIVRLSFGIDVTPKWINSKEELSKQSERFGIKSDFMYSMDTTRYFVDIFQMFRDTLLYLDSEEVYNCAQHDLLYEVRNDDLQPVQFRLFDSLGNEVFKMVNCYLEPVIPTMNWNVKGCFDAFPPKTDIEALNTHTFHLDFILEHLDTAVSLSDLPSSKFYAVVFWNSYFIKPTRKLLETLESKIGLDHKEVTFIYVNNHNAHVWYDLTVKQKEKVLNLKSN